MSDLNERPDRLSAATSKPMGGRPAEPPLAADPIRIAFGPTTHGQPPIPRSFSLLEFIERLTGGEAYGAPRVFDMFTAFAIMVAWAIIFALINLLRPMIGDDLPIVTLAVSLYVALIGLFQAALFGGKKPRLASVCGGPLAWIFVGAVVLSLQPWRTGSFRWDAMIYGVVGLLCSAPLGLFIGYLAGGVVAGVFLLGDLVRQKFMPPDSEIDAGDECDDAIWGHPDADTAGKTGVGDAGAERGAGNSA